MTKFTFITALWMALSLCAACEHIDWDSVYAEQGGADVEKPDNGGGSGVVRPGPETGKGSLSNPYGIAEVRTDTVPDSLQCWVCGYVVGYTKNNTMKNAVFSADSASAANIIIADVPTETDYTQCMPVELNTTALKKALSLQYNPDSLGVKVAVCGTLLKYYNVRGVRSVADHEWQGAGK